MQGSLSGVIYDHWDDPKLIEEVKSRLQSVIRDWLETDRTDISDFEAVHKNLMRLRSLDGDQPAKCKQPTPEDDRSVCLNEKRENYTGKLVFLEFPLGSALESGEYIVVKQSADSLYAVFTATCLSGTEVVRIPLDGVMMLDACEDDEFIHDFIERSTTWTLRTTDRTNAMPPRL